jgi:hypothetical protein
MFEQHPFLRALNLDTFLSIVKTIHTLKEIERSALRCSNVLSNKISQFALGFAFEYRNSPISPTPTPVIPIIKELVSGVIYCNFHTFPQPKID